jgi:hypothetical protein
MSIHQNGIKSAISSARRDVIKNQRSFVALATNPWQALSIDAAVSRLEGSPRGTIIITPHPNHGHLINQSSFYFQGKQESTFIFVHPVSQSSVRMLMKGVQTPLSYFLSTFSSSNKNQVLNIITPQLGYRVLARLFTTTSILSEFYPHYITLEYSLGKLLNNPFMTESKSRIRRMYETLCSIGESIYFSKQPLDRRHLFSLNQYQKITVNKEVIKDYQRVLPSDFTSADSEDSLLFVSQPLVSSGVCDKEMKTAMIRHVAEFANRRFDQIMIKPHPRESIKQILNTIRSCVDIQTDLIDNSVAIERVVPELAPTAVIGITSSSLVKINALFSIDAYTIANIMSRMSHNENIVHLCDRFVSATTDYVSPCYL